MKIAPLPLLTMHDLEARLACSSRHIRNLITRGRISSIKLGGALRFDSDVLEQEIAAMTTQSKTLASAQRTAKLAH